MSVVRRQCLGGIGTLDVFPPLPPDYSDMKLQFLEFFTGYFVLKNTYQNSVHFKYFISISPKVFQLQWYHFGHYKNFL